MPKKVRMPDGVVVSFPDDMPDASVKQLIANKFPDAAAKAAASQTPTAQQRATTGPFPAPAAQDRRVPLMAAQNAPIPMKNAGQDGQWSEAPMVPGRFHYDTPEDLRKQASAKAEGRYVTANPANAARSFASGVPVLGGLADEAEAGVKSLAGADYDAELTRIRAGNREFERNSPGSATVLPIAGGVAAGIGLGAAAPKAANVVFGGGGKGLVEKVARGAASGGFLSGAHGFAAGEGGFAERAANAGQEAVTGAALGAVTPAVTHAAGKVLGARPNVPSNADLRVRSDALYDFADNSGVMVNQSSFQKAVAGIARDVERKGIDHMLTPDAHRALERLQLAAGNGAVPIRDVQTLREVIGVAAGSAKPKERMIAEMMIERLDDFTEGLTPGDVVGGDPKNVGGILSEARTLWSRMRKSETIDALLDNARLKSETASGPGLERAISTEFKNFATNAAKMRRFSAEEQDAIRHVATGGLGVKALRAIAHFSPHNPLFSAIGTGSAYTVLGPAALAVPAAGAAARLGAGKATAGNAKAASATARAGGGPVTRQLDPKTEALFRRLGASAAPALSTAFRRRA